jgi:hypothetical protein
MLQTQPILGALLVVVVPSVSLNTLRRGVDYVTCEEQVILWLNSESIACKDGGVDDKSASHATGDATINQSVSN